jgi:uncharacterized SAM-binding protein YcdF (DUF218 family)
MSFMRRPSARAVLLVIGVALVVALAFAGEALIVDRPLDDPDAIVSLASHEWERLPVAAAAARRYPQATVILTLPATVSRYNCHDCAHRVERLVAAGVSAARVRIVPLGSGGTYGEALACREVASQTPFRRLLIVTSPYHTRRALAAFRSVFGGTDVRVGITPAWSNSPATPGRWWGSPYDRWYVSYEWAGTLFYAARYGVLPVVGG